MKALFRWTAWMVWAAVLLGTQPAVAQPTSADALIEQYYQNILGRASDAGGKAYWLSEVQRTQDLGVDVKEAFLVMAGIFFNSPEYTGKNTSNAQFVADLYQTFLNRTPDGGGLAYWTGLLSAGVSRAVVMNGFMFAPEFATYMASLPGNATSRPEVYESVDFYRGLLGRLPDNAGFDYWLNQFQTAQCGGAGMVYSSTEILSSSFAASPEYLARNRSDIDYVSDLYYAFLRRAADQAGFLYWVTQLSSKAATRDDLRRAFIASPEFTSRVNAVIAAGCVPSPDPCTLTTATSGTSPTDVPAACSASPTPTDGSCDMTLALACTGGTPTSYGWSTNVSNPTLVSSTAPPVKSQKVTITTPQTFSVAAGNARGTAAALPVAVTVGGSSVGGGGSGGTGGSGGSGGAYDCSAQGFGLVHSYEFTLNQPYTLDTSWSGTQFHIPPSSLGGTTELIVLKITMPPGGLNFGFKLGVNAYPAYEEDAATTIVWSTNPCDWDGSDKTATHYGLQQTSNSTYSFYYVIGGPDATGLALPVLPAGVPLYLIIANRYYKNSSPLGYYTAGQWTCDSGHTCNKRISISAPGSLN